METANETLGEENARLKLALENLHMLFRDKFQTVSLNDKAEEALAEKKERDFQISSLQDQVDEAKGRLEAAKEKMDDVQDELAELATELDQRRGQLADALTELDEARGKLGEHEARIRELRNESASQRVAMRFQMAGKSLRKQMLAQAQQDKSDLDQALAGDKARFEEAQAEHQRVVAGYEARVAALEGKLAARGHETEAALAAQAALVRRRATRRSVRRGGGADVRGGGQYRAQAERGRSEAEEGEEEEEGGLLDVGAEQPAWERTALLGSGGGLARLRDLLLEQRRAAYAPSGLGRDEVLGAVRIARRICDDRAAEEALAGAGANPLPLPEYVYGWFGRQATHRAADARLDLPAVSLRARGDAECSRFLDALERLHPKSRELAMFGEVLDACEADEVAYFVQARRALLPPAESSEVAPLLSLEAARRGCEALIMRQASDVHARRVRTSVTERLLAKPGVLVRGGAPVEEPARVDGAALLGELMRVQREEKRELCRMLQQLHATGAGLPGFPEVHRLRAVLQAVEPDVSDAELLEIFQRASVAAPHPVPEAPGRAPLRTVPFANLWAALQRHGFLARRQRLGALSAPGEGSGGGAAAGPRERDAAAAVAEIWMALHSQARALVGRLARSPLQAHRDAAARAAALVDVVQESASVAAAAPHLVPRLRRLLPALYTLQTLRDEYGLDRSGAGRPDTPVALHAELQSFARLIVLREDPGLALRDARALAAPLGRGPAAAHALSPTSRALKRAPGQNVRVSRNPKGEGLGVTLTVATDAVRPFGGRPLSAMASKGPRRPASAFG